MIVYVDENILTRTMRKNWWDWRNF
jgi:hypothetical protein